MKKRLTRQIPSPNRKLLLKKSFNSSSVIIPRPIPITIALLFFSTHSLGKFVNMTAKFYPTSIMDLDKNEVGKHRLILCCKEMTLLQSLLVTILWE
jgi:hypothetical protein